MKSFLVALSAVLVTGMAGPILAQPLGETSRIEFEVRRWRPKLASDLRLSGNGFPGSDFDPVHDLGLDTKQGFDFRISLRVVKRLKLRGSRVEFTYEGTQPLEQDLTIDGIFVPAGTNLESTMDIEHLKFGAEFDVVSGHDGFLAVVGEWGRFISKPRFESGGIRHSVDPERLKVQLLMFGLKTRVYLTPALAVGAEFSGMQRQSEGVMTDFDAMVTYNLIPNLAVSYGYRNAYNRVKSIEAEGDRATFRLRGNYVGISIRF